MKTYILMLWLGYAAPITQDNLGGGAGMATNKHVFWSKEACLRAAAIQIASWEKAGFKRYSAVCFEDFGPGSAEPAVVGK